MKKNDLLFLSIAIFLLVFAWTVFNIYHKAVKSTISQTINTQIIPINPNFDTKTLDQLKKRQKITPILEMKKNLSEKENPQEAASKPSVNITPLPLSSSSASQSTQGGTLK